MPVLDWIGKSAVVRHDAEVPFRLLQDVPELACGEAGGGNLIVEGDNLLALKALLPHYSGQVKCIYIDPPYNTGQDERDGSGKRTGWVYSDNVGSPEMREWLGRVVGEQVRAVRREGGVLAALDVDVLDLDSGDLLDLVEAGLDEVDRQRRVAE